MAKFCTKCGKELKDGKPCSCEGAKEKATVKESAPTGIGEQIKELFKGAFKTPYDMTKKTTNASYFATALIAILASAIGLTLVLVKTLKITYASGVNAIGSTVGLGNLSSMTSLNVDIPKMTIMVVFLVAVFYLVYTGVAYIYTNKIQHKDNSFKEIISSMAVPATVSTVFSVASWLLMYLLGILALFGVIAGLIIVPFYRYQALIISTKVDSNKAGYLILATQFTTTIMLVIVMMVMGATSYIEASPSINGLTMIQSLR